MIRINLLRRERVKDKKVKAPARAPSQMMGQLGFVAVFVVTLAVIAFLWLDVQGKKDALESEYREATQERERLRSVEELVNRLEAERERLATRLQTLSNLKDNLRTPYYGIGVIWAAYLPQENNRDFALSSVSQETDSDMRFVVEGEASRDALLRFHDNLNSFTKLVQRVRILEHQYERDGRFELLVEFVNFGDLRTESQESEAAAGVSERGEGGEGS